MPSRVIPALWHGVANAPGQAGPNADGEAQTRSSVSSVPTYPNWMAVPYPDDTYLTLLGKAAYAVSYLEWTALGDLSGLPGLPSELSLAKLAGKTTRQIADTFDRHATKVGDPASRHFVQAAATELRGISARRNDILHARPATIGGEQRLYRWMPNKAEVIDLDMLRDFIDLVDGALARLGQMRVRQR